MKRLLLLPVLALLFWACSDSSNSSDSTKAPDDRVKFIVLQLNDVYEISPLESGTVGGLARVATLRKQLLAENPNTITVLSGDFLSPSLTGTLRLEDGEKINGKHMVDVLNAMGLDYVTFGNHEFDLSSKEDLQKRINESEFTWTTINCFQQLPNGAIPFEKELADGTKERFPFSIQHKIESDKGSITLGLIGMTLQFNLQPYVNYSDEFLSTKAEFDRISPECDILMGITHLNIEQDRQMAQEVPGFALLLGGHDHDHMEEMVGNVRITKADANAKTVYVHRVAIDPKTKEYTIESELVPINSNLDADPEVDAVVKKWEAVADKSILAMGYDPDEELMTAEEPLDGRESSIRNHQTNLGDLLTNAMLRAAEQNAEVALFNSGSVRLDDQLTGVVVQYDVLRSLPYGGPVAFATFSGPELEKTLETGTVTNVGKGGFLQIMGASKSESGQWMVGEEPLDPERNYGVVLPEFLIEGRETNLEFLKSISSKTPETLGEQGIRNDVRDILMAEMRLQGGQE